MTGPAQLDDRVPLCSIIIPVFNRQDTVAQTVESCLTQDYPRIEIILVDDGSTDHSAAICQIFVDMKHPEGKVCRLYRQQNSGACVARNRGMDLATGDFLLFLDSDDTIPVDKISIQVAALEQSGADCSISDFMTVDANDQPLAVYRNDLPPIEFITRLKSPSNSAIIMRRSSLPDLMRWNTSLKRMQDFDFMLRYLSGVHSWIYVPKPLYNYRLHNGARISDTYKDGMPYAEMFRSMAEHLRRHPPKMTTRLHLLPRYFLVLVRAHLKDTISRFTPLWLKSPLKNVIRTMFRGRIPD